MYKLFLNMETVLQITLTHNFSKLMSDSLTAASLTCVMQKNCPHHQPVSMWAD
jgi:hypothetical protein